jgi:hypothetical protein
MEFEPWKRPTRHRMTVYAGGLRNLLLAGRSAQKARDAINRPCFAGVGALGMVFGDIGTSPCSITICVTIGMLRSASAVGRDLVYE